MLLSSVPSWPQPVDVVAHVVADLALTLVMARVVGGLFIRFGQPRVVGEMIAGIVIGPTVLGGSLATSPGRGSGSPGTGLVGALFPAQAYAVVEAIGTVGLVLFMFLIGLELPRREFREQVRRVVAIGVAVVAAATGLGFVLAAVLSAPVWRVVASSDGRVVPPIAHALMIGGALAATALPVVAAILRDRELMLTRVGTVGVGACAVITPLTFLVVDAAVAGNGLVWVVGLRLLMLGALVVALIGVARPLLRKLLCRAVAHGRELSSGVLAVLVAGAVLTGAVAAAVGVGALTGGLLFGMTVPRIDGLVESVRTRLRQPVVIVGVPVFLAVTGLQTNLRVLRPEHVGAIALLVVASVVGKWGVATLVGRVVGMPGRDAAAVGTMLACGGLMTLVVVHLGREAGILTTSMQAALVSTAVISTMVTAPLMVWCAVRCERS